MGKSIKYNILGLFVSDAVQGADIPKDDIKEIKRVQGASLSAEENVLQNASLGTLKTKEYSVDVIPKIAFSYYPTNGEEESLMGLSADEKVGILFPSLSFKKNFYLLADKSIFGENFNMVSVGDASLDSYSVSCDAKGILTAQASFVGRNALFNSNTEKEFPVPNVSPSGENWGEQYTFSLPSFTNNIEKRKAGKIGKQVCITGDNVSLSFLDWNTFEQPSFSGFNLSFSVSRSENMKIGDVFPEKTPITVAEGSFSLSAVMRTDLSFDFIKMLRENKLNNVDIICKTCDKEILGTFFESCSPNSLIYKIRGAKLISVSSENSINDTTKISIEYKIYFDDLLSLEKNVLLSGRAGNIFYTANGWGRLKGEAFPAYVRLSGTGGGSLGGGIGAYFNLGIVPTSSMSMEVKYRRPNSTFVSVAGARNGVGTGSFYILDAINPINTGRFRWDRGSQQVLGGQTVVGEINTAKITPTEGILNGTKVATLNGLPISVSHPILLGCSNTAGFPDWYIGYEIDIFSCKIWEGEVLIKSLLPSKKENGDIVMIDEVSGGEIPLSGTSSYAHYSPKKMSFNDLYNFDYINAEELNIETETSQKTCQIFLSGEVDPFTTRASYETTETLIRRYFIEKDVFGKFGENIDKYFDYQYLSTSLTSSKVDGKDSYLSYDTRSESSDFFDFCIKGTGNLKNFLLKFYSNDKNLLLSISKVNGVITELHSGEGTVSVNDTMNTRNGLVSHYFNRLNYVTKDGSEIKEGSFIIVECVPEGNSPRSVTKIKLK